MYGVWAHKLIHQDRLCVYEYALSTFPHACQVSLPLVTVLGQDSKSAEWLTVFLTEIVTFNLSVWSSEDKLCVTSIELFNSLVKLNTRRWATFYVQFWQCVPVLI